MNILNLSILVLTFPFAYVIGHLKPDHAYFKSDYVKPKRMASESDESDDQLNNDDGFFNDLPLSRNKNARRRINFNPKTTLQKEEKQLQRMQKQMKKHHKKL